MGGEVDRGVTALVDGNGECSLPCDQSCSRARDDDLGFGSLILEMVRSASRHASGVSLEYVKGPSEEGDWSEYWSWR